MTGEDLLQIASRFVGVCEGDPRLPIATAKRAWCAAFLTEVELAAGLSAPTDTLHSWNAEAHVEYWARRGCEVPLSSGGLERGDVLMFDRHDETGRVIGHHVALFCGYPSPGEVELLNGNSGPKADRVAITRRPLVQVRRAVRVVLG